MTIVKTQNAKIILGLKVKQLRQQKELSSKMLSKEAGLSLSYLNEIEKGKKYPKADKLHQLAAALGVSYQELTSIELTKELSPVAELLRSNFLNELPLDLFGIDLQKVVEMIANAPAKVGAFISTLLELSRNYELREENFYFGALRSYLELHHNYFSDIEDAVEAFLKKYKLSEEESPSLEQLQGLLAKNFGYKIIENGLDAYPDLQMLRSVYVPNTKKLLLSTQLTDRQKLFQFGKEIGFNVLNLEERANTSSLLKGRNFEEVLNHSKSIYFSVALLMNKKQFSADMDTFFEKEKWEGDAFLKIMKKYDATPEMFYHRLTNILPKIFGMKKMFFLRFVHNLETGKFGVDKELHLTHKHHPHSNGLSEHYCRRWISIDLLHDLRHMQLKGQHVDHIVSAQISTYYGTEDTYLCLTIARPAYPSPHKNVSVTLGLLITDELKDNIKFLRDPAITHKEVNKTCERCPIKDCEERAVPPTVIQERIRRANVQRTLKKLTGE